MATGTSGLGRANYLSGVDLTNSNTVVRLTVMKDNNPSADTVDSSTTHTTISLAQLSTLLVANKPEIAALTAASTAADIVAALKA